MNRFDKGDRVRFKQNDKDWDEGVVSDDPFLVDHNPTYPIQTASGEQVYVNDVSPNKIEGV